MSEKNCVCKCNSDSKEFPVVIGGIVVYELAIIIVLLILIYLESTTTTAEAEETVNEQSFQMGLTSNIFDIINLKHGCKKKFFLTPVFCFQQNLNLFLWLFPYQLALDIVNNLAITMTMVFFQYFQDFVYFSSVKLHLRKDLMCQAVGMVAG